MAKFVTEDGRDGISGDKFMAEYQTKNHNKTYTEMWLNAHPIKRHSEIEKIKIPHGKRNSDRLLNSNIYDILSHMQETLSLTNRCVIELITNEDHRCINMNEAIQRHINIFADKCMPESFRDENPRMKIRYKVPDTEDQFEYRWETDEEWYDRLCHIFMHRMYPQKLQTIKCDECLQQWLNSDKW